MTTTVTTIAAIVAIAGSAAAQSIPTAIMQSSGIGANSVILGPDGNTYTFDRFDRPVKSGTGAKWIMLARNTSGSSTDAMFVTGMGSSYQMVALENVSVFETVDGTDRFFSTSDRYVDINENGDWVGIGNLNGGASDDDEVVFAGDFLGGTLSLPFREGQTVATGDLLGSGNYGPTITDAGAIGFGFSLSTGTSDIGYFLDDGTTRVLARGDALLPSGNVLDTPFGGRNAFQTTPDGSSWLVIGEEVTPAGDVQVLIKDGTIVLSVGDVFTTDSGTLEIAAIRGEQNMLESDGSWYTRVGFTDGTGGAIVNGQLVAASGDPVGGSVAGETWSELPWASSSDTTFALVTGNGNGDVALGGFTDNADGARNFVWMVNGVEVLRSGDQIDVDCDGTLDDAFIFTSSFTTASPQQLGGFLTDDGVLYTLVDVRNAASTLVYTAFISVDAVKAGPCSDADLAEPFGTLDIFDILTFFDLYGEGSPEADLNDDAALDIFDILLFFELYGAGC